MGVGYSRVFGGVWVGCFMVFCFYLVALVEGFVFGLGV